MRLQARRFGPFVKGVIDRANPSLDLSGALKNAKGLVLSGAGELLTRGGTALALTFKDDAGTPANVTAVLAVEPFADGAIVLAHSTSTNKVYIYRLKIEASGFTGWHDAEGSLTSDATPEPAGIVWASITDAPDVSVAEGLGLAYIAHTESADASTLSYPTRVFSPSPTALVVTSITSAATTATVTAAAAHNLRTGDRVVISDADQTEYNGTYVVTVTGASTFTYTFAGSGTTPATGTITYKAPVTTQVNHDSNPMFALWVASFKNHLWVGGVGSGTSGSDHYRPELARYSAPSFGAFSSADSITLGDRVRSQREKIIRGIAVGDALFLAGPFMLSRVIGFGRVSWQREQLDKTNGVVGPKAACAAGDTLYAWGARGPYRCHAGGRVEPLWDGIAAAIETVINPSKIVACYDDTRDLVLFFYDSGSGVRTFCAWDIRRNVWIGPDDDIGLAIRNAGSVAPVYASTAAPTLGPAGAPTNASTTNVTSSSAKANWSSGDGAATTRVEYRRQSDTAWTTAVTALAAGVTSYTISGLTAGVEYEWRARHEKDGTASAYLGPAAATQFETTATSEALSAPTSLSLMESPSTQITASWNNSESGALTEVHLSGPSASEPASGTYVLQESLATPSASSSPMAVASSGTWWVKVKHTKSGFDDSAFTSAESIEITGDPE